MLNKKNGKEKSREINVGSIEEDVDELKSIMNLRTVSGFAYSQKNTLSLQKAIKNVLTDYTRQKQINEEHQKTNGELREKVKELEEQVEYDKTHIYTPLTIQLNFIPKQKIKDMFEESQTLYEKKLKEIDFDELKNISLNIFEGIKVEVERGLLRRLLQESEDK